MNITFDQLVIVSLQRKASAPRVGLGPAGEIEAPSCASGVSGPRDGNSSGAEILRRIYLNAKNVDYK